LLIAALRDLADHGFQRAVVIQSQPVGSARLEQVVADHRLPIEVEFVQQAEPRGMGDAILRAGDQLEGPFCVVAPYQVRAGRILQRLRETGSDAAVCSAPTDHPEWHGMLSIDGDRAIGLVEKPAPQDAPSNQKIQAAYCLPAEFLDLLRQEIPAEYNFETALNTLMGQRQVALVRSDQALPSLKYPWQLFEFQSDYWHDRATTISDQAEVAQSVVVDDTLGPVVIEAGASVGHAARLVGPCYLGRDAYVGDYCLIRGSSIEAKAVVGAFSELARSIVMPGASLHQSYVADSIVGESAALGAGLITANRRLDRRPITVTVAEKKVATGLARLGSVIGHQANVGVRTTTMPGVMIGAQAVVYPGVTLYDHVPAGGTAREPVNKEPVNKKPSTNKGALNQELHEH